MTDNIERYPAIGDAVYDHIREQGKSGTLKDITTITEKVWMVRFHVVHPADSIEIFAVAQKGGQLTVSPHGKDTGRGVTWEYADHGEVMRIYHDITERHDDLFRELARDD